MELLLLDRTVDLLEEGLDAAVRIARLPDSSLLAVPLGHVRRVCCASPDLLAYTDSPTHPAALERLPCVKFSGLDAGRLVTVLREFEIPPVPANIVYPHTRLVSHRTRLLVDKLRATLRGGLTNLGKQAAV